MAGRYWVVKVASMGACRLALVECSFLLSLGTNNARLAAMLRQLAQYHAKDPNNLFMVRLAQVIA